MEDRELYDVRSASRRARRSRWTIYHWMRDGMPYQVIGGRRYVAHDDLIQKLRGTAQSRIQHARRHDARGRFTKAQENCSELV